MTQETSYIRWTDLQDAQLQTVIHEHLIAYTDYLITNNIKKPRDYTYIIKQLLITQSIHPNAITPEHIDTFLRSHDSKHKHTINLYISRIRKWLRYINKDFADFIQTPQTRTQPRYDQPDIPDTLHTALQDELTQYITYLTTFGRAKTYIRTNTQTITIFQKAIPKTTTNLTDHDIINFIQTLQQRQLNPSTINTYRRQLRLYLKYHGQEQLFHNIPPLKTPSPLKRTAPFDHVKILLLESAKPSYPHFLHPLLTLVSYTGIRIGTILTLKTTDIDLQDNWIRFWTKGQKEQKLPINPTVSNILTDYITETDPPLLLFPTKPTTPNTQITPQRLRYWLRRLSHNTKLPYYNPHAYRRAIATYLYYASNENLLFVKQFLNHANVQTTIDYIDVDYDKFQSTYDKLTHELSLRLLPEPQQLPQVI